MRCLPACHAEPCNCGLILLVILSHLDQTVLFQQRRTFLNHYGAKDLAASFRTVRKNTILTAQDIPEEKYGFRAAPDTRSVAELLSHIALGFNFAFLIHKERRKNLD